MEVEILQEALDLARAKTDLAADFLKLLGGRLAMKTVAVMLGMTRSNLIARRQTAEPARSLYLNAKVSRDSPRRVDEWCG